MANSAPRYSAYISRLSAQSSTSNTNLRSRGLGKAEVIANDCCTGNTSVNAKSLGLSAGAFAGLAFGRWRVARSGRSAMSGCVAVRRSEPEVAFGLEISARHTLFDFAGQLVRCQLVHPDRKRKTL